MRYEIKDIPTHLAKYYACNTIRAIDSIAITEYQLPLMERAGTSLAHCIRENFSDCKNIAIFAGSGNNGGDAWVCARMLEQLGIKSHCFYSKLPTTKDAKRAYEQYISGQGQAPIHLQNRPDLSMFDLIVDGLLGSGLSQSVSAQMHDIIEHINSQSCPVLAIDIPSGLNGDSGQPQGIAVEAQQTLTYVGLKPGLITAQGKDYSGHLLFDELTIPQAVYDRVSPIALVHPPSYDLNRRQDSHKGQFGTVWVVGGASGMPGAVLLAAESALRSGAGLVQLVTHSDHASYLPMYLPEVMTHSVFPPMVSGTLVLGPGLGQNAWSKTLFNQSLASPLVKVIDADGLKLLAKQPQYNTQWVLTPHPKEAAILLGCDTASVQIDRMGAAQQLAEKYGGVIVLKGCGTIITDGLTTYLCPYGNPALASAGMGDVLSGLIGGLLAQNLTLLQAATNAVYVHAQMGDQLFPHKGWGLQASDISKAYCFK